MGTSTSVSIGSGLGLLVIVGIVFLLVGVILLVVRISQGKKANNAASWPTAMGVILSSGLKENRHYDSETHRTSVTYEPQVQYQYTLMGANYLGTSLAFGKASYDYNTAAKMITPYPQGAPVTVHYDPGDPSKAVLETKVSGGVLLIVMSLIFTVIGVVFLVLGLIG